MNKATDTQTDDTRRDDDRVEGTKSPEQLEREVDQARARLGRTASELSDRLSPGELIDQALGMAREHGGEFGRNLGAQVKNNPMPMILTSIGISWLMMSSGHNGAAQAHDTYNKNTGKDGRSLMDAFGDTATKSQDKAAAAGDRMHGASANVKESAQNAREGLVQFYRDQPLIAGSLGIAIGAALGALVPTTEIEDDMLGEARDRSVNAAKSEAARKYDEVRESARSE
ncbi:DUF3618 domain-containing protein [Halomonas sp. MA07-2]|uniref:DUF3618 domain-containing protein n=1 Tax=Halomonas sp. MA07-2 TaxID=3440841 RepID=UPI003EEE55AA